MVVQLRTLFVSVEIWGHLSSSPSEAGCMTATRWSYAALDAAGDARTGVVDAGSESEAAKIVRTLGLRPMTVRWHLAQAKKEIRQGLASKESRRKESQDA